MKREKNKILFDEKWYQRHYPESLEYPEDSYNHYINIGWKKGYDPSPYFSTEQYLKKNPDVKNSGKCPLIHYLSDGEKEGRSVDYSLEYYADLASEKKLYDEVYYKQQVQSKITLNNYFVHYVEKGYKEGYNPSPNFSTDRYLKVNSDIGKDVCPLLHYLIYGEDEGRKPFKVDPQLEGIYSKRNEMILPRIKNRLKYYNIIKKNKNKKFLVILHFFYYTSWIEIQSYLENLSPYNYDLYITYIEGQAWEEYHQKIQLFKPDTVFIKVENIGFDIASYIEVLNMVDLSSYKAVFKIQTKGTYNRAEIVNGKYYQDGDWFTNLFDAILGPENVHKTISLMDNNKIGMVGAKNLIVTDLPYLRSYLTRQLKLIKVDVPEKYSFVAGTCFCVRAEIANEFKKFNYNSSIFCDSIRGSFSMAHAFERYLGFFVQLQGYSIYGIDVDQVRQNKWKELEKSLAKYSGLRLLNDNRILLSDDCIVRNLDTRIVRDYQIESIELDKLKAIRKGNVNYIYELAPYKYLTDNNKYYSEYINYCRLNRRNDFYDYSESEFNKLDDTFFIDQFWHLYSEFNAKNYNDSKRLIVVDKETNYILDGLHRASILYHEFGGNYKINVLMIHYGNYDCSSAIPYTNKLRNTKTRKYEHLD